MSHSVFVLGIANAHFTRLVVTNLRLIIVQGYAVCRSWNMDELPLSLIRFGMHRDGEGGRTIDLDAVKSLFGGASDQVTDARSILAFGKQLDRIQNDKKGRSSSPDG